MFEIVIWWYVSRYVCVSMCVWSERVSGTHYIFLLPDDCREAVLLQGGVPAILAAMRAYPASEALHLAACNAIHTICGSGLFLNLKIYSVCFVDVGNRVFAICDF